MAERQIEFCAPALTYFDQHAIERIHTATAELLEQSGCRLLHPEAIALLKKYGCRRGPQNSVTISMSLVERALDTAPSTITIHDREKAPAMILEKRNVTMEPDRTAPTSWTRRRADACPLTWMPLNGLSGSPKIFPISILS
jgi:trimethylamine:corrinoid methyltransferase-like protein